MTSKLGGLEFVFSGRGLPGSLQEMKLKRIRAVVRGVRMVSEHTQRESRWRLVETPSSTLGWRFVG
jgi:hypothetical protein